MRSGPLVSLCTATFSAAECSPTISPARAMARVSCWAQLATGGATWGPCVASAVSNGESLTFIHASASVLPPTLWPGALTTPPASGISLADEDEA